MRNPPVLTSPLLPCPHGFSTRLGGRSRGAFAALNLARPDACGDDPEAVRANWLLFGAAVGIDTGRLVCGRQVHGARIHAAAPADARRITEPAEIEADGYVTNHPGLALAVYVADCAPLLLCEPEAGVVAAVHCGWRCVAADIVGNALSVMASLGAVPGRVRAAVGPCIRRCCFQTGPEVPEALDRMLDTGADGLFAPDPAAPGKFLTDLPGAVLRRLTELGVPREQIDDLNECTMCQPDRFWSHRRLGLARGAQAALIALPGGAA